MDVEDDLIACPLCQSPSSRDAGCYFHVWWCHVGGVCWCGDTSATNFEEWQRHVVSEGGLESHVLSGLLADRLRVHLGK
jgi:hypothetical protein